MSMLATVANKAITSTLKGSYKNIDTYYVKNKKKI